ncbi:MULTISPECIES: trimeric intracellular cation channel family protein [Flavobacteriaceae]|uniref:Trimeric intracellular cation channel family protein n=1 Tax=Flagellimonas sp. MMG031 TaxID=3158549 RepID=A0AAU7N2E5_9FLAO|nr:MULTISPECIES: trimeric intracellular cation channel family protein [unclassified Allomuricauda]MBO6531590.1 trimeric intracellular cation channel family protein [Allomuricauda sp.]MBO6590236.1 trimeric intracellular cation channel family protein [Allomuricauda sp.]MBO6619862.1 trimeric intracellular cation channel family protein [Allomuricauda sp.]MBO6645796.1 trimeric intracellular cation channel family protein [Allomuricauda sp.]MBO6748200.1 trimeric intracellular cation channel family pr
MLYLTIDILGTIAFAISGVLVAMEKRLDLFGVLIIAFVTAIGGGTLRDLLIGNTPVGWMHDLTYVITIFISVVFAIIFVNKLKYLRKSLFLFDTIGIGLYTMVGVEKGLEAQLLPIMCVFLGTMTACFGGVIRDILCNEIPVIFRKEIYATACILGALSYFLIVQLPVKEEFAYIAGILIVIILRLLAVKFKISLPSIYKRI